MIIPAILCIPVVKGLKESPAWVKNKALGAVSVAVNQVTKKQNYAELFKPQYRKFTIIATVMHVVGGIFTWGINIWFPSAMMLDFHVDKIAAAFITMLMWGCGTFGYLAAGVLQDKFGRKKTITAYVTTALAAVLMLNYLHTLPNVPMTYLYATALVLGLSLGTHTVLITYSTEIYPSHVRTLGVGFSVGVGKIGSMLCPTLMGVIADASSVTLALLVSSAIGWLLVPVILQGPETAGKKLEDIVD
jgi:MFS family permease